MSLQFSHARNSHTTRSRRRGRVLLAAPLLAVALGSGFAAAQPASAAARPDAHHFLSTVIPCESGGDPRVVNSIGAGGLFQFMPTTWRSVGGTGLPQDATVAEQWKRAHILFDQQGTSPWYASKTCWAPRL